MQGDWRKWIDAAKKDLEQALEARKAHPFSTSAAMWAEVYATELLGAFVLLAEAIEADFAYKDLLVKNMRSKKTDPEFEKQEPILRENMVVRKQAAFKFLQEVGKQ